MKSCLLLACVAAISACGGESGVAIPAATKDGTEPPPGTSTPADPTPSGTATAVAPTDPTTPTGPWPGSQLVVVTFPAQKTAPVTTCGQALVDITSHLHPSYGTQYDYTTDCITWGQINTLGIDNYLTVYFNPAGTGSVGFYLMKNRTAYLVQPPTTKLADVGTTLPTSLRGPSYQTRLVDSLADWNDDPSYVLDELAIELNGAEVAMDFAAKPPAPREMFLGAVETALYSLALGQAVTAKDAAYLKAQPQFRELLAFQVERAMTFVKNGAAVPAFASATQNTLLSTFQTGPTALALRNWSRDTFGADYCTKVLGIAAPKE